MTTLPDELEARAQVLTRRYAAGEWQEKYLSHEILDFARAVFAAGWAGGAEATLEKMVQGIDEALVLSERLMQERGIPISPELMKSIKKLGPMFAAMPLPRPPQ